jgi:hypothetical protein
MEFGFPYKSIELVLDRCDVLGRFLLGIPALSLKVAHYLQTTIKNYFCCGGA